MITDHNLFEQIRQAAHFYNNLNFIENDPIVVPHHFTKPADIELAGFFAAILAWGQRPNIIKVGLNLMDRMEWEPYSFVINHQQSDLHRLKNFVYRTFNSYDLIFILKRLNALLNQFGSIGAVFRPEDSIKSGLINLHNIVFDGIEPKFRTRKHIANPAAGSACKRLNMYLRWMVRNDQKGVDFGIWKHVDQTKLMIPLDVHVAKTARNFGFLSRKANDWKAVDELTVFARLVFPNDPALVDFALFGLSINAKKIV